MARHVVASLAELPPGSRKLVEAEGRRIAVFNVNGEFFAINDRCPHEGGSLCKGKLTSLVQSNEPGEFQLSRDGEILRCPWHGWEFDLRTGRSVCDPRTMRVRLYEVRVEHGDEVLEDARTDEQLEKELVAETFSVSVEDDYVVVEV